MRRLLALVLTVAAMSAPLSLALCHMECADAMAHQDQPRHACHGTTEPGALAMSAVPHMCAHEEEAPAGLERTLQTVAAPVAVPALPVWTPPADVERIVPVAVEPSPPRSLQSISQLRV